MTSSSWLCAIDHGGFESFRHPDGKGPLRSLSEAQKYWGALLQWTIRTMAHTTFFQRQTQTCASNTQVVGRYPLQQRTTNISVFMLCSESFTRLTDRTQRESSP